MFISELDKCLFFNSAIANTNNKFGLKLTVLNFRIIYILYKWNCPLNKWKIQITLSRLSISVNYPQLSKALNYLVEIGFIEGNLFKDRVRYSLNLRSLEVIHQIAKYIRRNRARKLINLKMDGGIGIHFLSLLSLFHIDF